VLYEDGEELDEDLVAQDWQLVERKETDCRFEQPQPATACADAEMLLDDAEVARQVHAELNGRHGRRAASFSAGANIAQGLCLHRAFGEGPEGAPVQQRKAQPCRRKEHDKIVEKVGSYNDNQLVAALRAGRHVSDIPKGSTVRQRERERQRDSNSCVAALFAPSLSLSFKGESCVSVWLWL
jgi:hypothetical protein